jgi:hypothetical protein
MGYLALWEFHGLDAESGQARVTGTVGISEGNFTEVFPQVQEEG